MICEASRVVASKAFCVNTNDNRVFAICLAISATWPWLSGAIPVSRKLHPQLVGGYESVILMRNITVCEEKRTATYQLIYILI